MSPNFGANFSKSGTAQIPKRISRNSGIGQPPHVPDVHLGGNELLSHTHLRNRQMKRWSKHFSGWTADGLKVDWGSAGETLEKGGEVGNKRELGFYYYSTQ